eukprot:TRINITY_DN7555_c0_g1_i1.p1 TRINITY_DN7555_c0_g1~~TRINITY_DN7555_c0_g1_i1.p1  ORF type:complete len:345 (+),score=72.58 TRINITY_DN7555_c0_g1_i1:76-1110(+)
MVNHHITAINNQYQYQFDSDDQQQNTSNNGYDYNNEYSSGYLPPISGGLVGDGYLYPMEKQQQMQQQNGLVTPPPQQLTPQTQFMSTIGSSTMSTCPSTTKTTFRHDPYSIDEIFQDFQEVRELSVPEIPELLDTVPPPEPVAPPVENIVWDVIAEFKHGRRSRFNYTLPVGSSPKVGTFYVVEGDRGPDLGKVISAQELDDDADYGDIERCCSGSVTREATPAEVSYWQHDLEEDEQSAVELVNEIVSRAKLPLKVRYASYQLDKKKLTFYYNSPYLQPDFRSVLAECYSFWKCRIWFTSLARPESSFFKPKNKPAKEQKRNFPPPRHSRHGAAISKARNFFK